MDIGVGAVGGIAHGGKRRLAYRQQLRYCAAGLCKPEVLTVAVAVADEDIRPILSLYAVDDIVVILLLHQHLVDAQYKVRAVLAGDTVEITVRGRIAAVFEGSAHILFCVFKIAHPSALHDLISLADHLGTRCGGIFGDAQTVLKSEAEIFHLLLRSVARPALSNYFLIILALIGHEVERDLTSV